MGSHLLRLFAAASSLSLLAAIGCGMAATPQPPSLYLPKPIANLAAARSGNSIALHWTTPRETTDRLTIKTPVRLKICRQTAPQTASQITPSPSQSVSTQGSTEVSCDALVATLSAAPGKPAVYTATIPASLTAGPLRPIYYQIFGLSRHGRHASPSNDAAVLAGKIPNLIAGLSATVVERGVLFHWQPATNLQPATEVRLQRTLLASPHAAVPATKKISSPASTASHPLGALPAPTEQTLIVKFPSNSGQPAGQPLDPGTALDATVTFGDRYQYAAQYVVHQHAGGRDLQAAGAPTAPMDVYVLDTFPPRSPARLAAIVVSAAMTADHAPEVDLSWSASTEPDFAQYRVDRRDLAANAAGIQIAPASASAPPLVAPTFRDTTVVPGHRYEYSVTALDETGNQSAPSNPVRVTIPPPN